MGRYDLEPRRRGVLSTIDDALLIGVVIIAAVFALHLVGWIIGGLVFVVKLAIVAGLVALMVGWLRRRRSA